MVGERKNPGEEKRRTHFVNAVVSLDTADAFIDALSAVEGSLPRVACLSC